MNSYQATAMESVVSMFPNLLSHHHTDITIEEALDLIKTGGTFKPLILNLRKSYKNAEAILDLEEKKQLIKDAETKFKKTLPGITFAGCFEERSNTSFTFPSGFICVDIDDVKDISTIKEVIEDDYVFCSFISPSNTGLKVLYRIEPEEDIKNFVRRATALYTYLQHKFRFELAEEDFKLDITKDVSRLCFLSWDPDIYVNMDSWVFSEIAPEKKYEKYTATDVTADVSEVTKAIETFIINSFSGLKHPNRHSTMISLVAKIKAWSIYHKLDFNVIQSIIVREYSKLFDVNEKQDRINTCIKFWEEASEVPAHPMKEFANSVSIEESLLNNYPAEIGIFNSLKSNLVPPEEEMKLLSIEVFYNKINEVKSFPILHIGNIFGIVANASSGKTSAVNSILAQALVPFEEIHLVKKMHISITKNVKRILVFDSELDFNNYPKFYDQLLLRIGLEKTKEHRNTLADDQRVHYFSMSEFSIQSNIVDAMIPFMDLIEKAFNNGNPYNLVVLDDITIFTPDVNDGKHVTMMVLKLKRLAKQYGFGIFSTIHANSGQQTGKGRGHSGSELERKAETVLHMTRDNDTELFKIEIGQGNKNRAGALTFAMSNNPLLAQWDDTAECIVGIDAYQSGLENKDNTNSKNKPRQSELMYSYVMEQINVYKHTIFYGEELKLWINDFYSKENKNITTETTNEHAKTISSKLREQNIVTINLRAGKSNEYIILNKAPIATKPKVYQEKNSLWKDETEIAMDFRAVEKYNEKLAASDDEDLLNINMLITEDNGTSVTKSEEYSIDWIDDWDGN
jgi:hypothetical protein